MLRMQMCVHYVFGSLPELSENLTTSRRCVHKATLASVSDVSAIACIVVCLLHQILDAMNQDCEPPFTQLKVDGGMTVNEALLRLQADLLGIAVGERERERERGKERLRERGRGEWRKGRGGKWG